MSWLDFVRLFRMIFGKKEPDLDAIQRMGLLAVKVGQVFALRIDFLGADKCRALGGLYSKQTKLPPQQFDRLLEQNGGQKFLDNFADFDREPFAVASIGQVHRARLKSGEQVAVKFVKQDYKPAFERDTARATLMLRTAQFFYPRLRGVANPLSLIQQLSQMTLKELDLSNEIRGNDILYQVYCESRATFDLDLLRFAVVHRGLSTETVLVKNYVAGSTFEELLIAGRLSYATLLELFRIHGFFMFVKGTFHGDIHPGNIVLGGDGRIYFIDTGYVGHVSDRIRTNLFRFFDALSQYNYNAAAHCLHAMSSVQIAPQKWTVFERKFLILYEDFTGMPVSRVSLTQKMMETIRLGVLCGMEFDAGMFDVIKSLMYLDGMVLRANPQAILLEDMRRFVVEFKATIA